MIVRENGSGDFESPEPGTYAARCFKLIDLGTQTDNYEGKETIHRKVIISWELESLMKDGRPFAQSSFYTASLGKKANLRRDLESWRGKEFTEEEAKGFNLKVLLGAPCMLSVIHNAAGKSRVKGVLKVPKGMVVPPAVNPVLYFNLDEFNEEVFNGLPDFFKKQIVRSPEYQKLGAIPNTGAEADMPF